MGMTKSTYATTTTTIATTTAASGTTTTTTTTSLSTASTTPTAAGTTNSSTGGTTATTTSVWNATNNSMNSVADLASEAHGWELAVLIAGIGLGGVAVIGGSVMMYRHLKRPVDLPTLRRLRSRTSCEQTMPSPTTLPEEDPASLPTLIRKDDEGTLTQLENSPAKPGDNSTYHGHETEDMRAHDEQIIDLELRGSDIDILIDELDDTVPRTSSIASF